MADGGEHQRSADVRSAEHANFAVRMRQRRGPLHRVVAVVHLVLEGVPLALGGVAAAHILDHDHEAARDSLAREVGAAVLVVGCALEQ